MTEKTETQTSKLNLLYSLASLALLATIMLGVQVGKPGDQLWQALLAGLCAHLTVVCIRAGLRAEIQASR